MIKVEKGVNNLVEIRRGSNEDVKFDFAKNGEYVNDNAREMILNDDGLAEIEFGDI